MLTLIHPPRSVVTARLDDFLLFGRGLLSDDGHTSEEESFYSVLGTRGRTVAHAEATLSGPNIGRPLSTRSRARRGRSRTPVNLRTRPTRTGELPLDYSRLKGPSSLRTQACLSLGPF